MASQFHPQSLTRIGRYTVVRFLAEGGMSWVFEVSDPDLFDARRALKLIKPHVLAEHEMLERFEDEVRLLARIEHPNLVRVYDYGSDAETGARFFTMEYIEGPHLGEVAAEYLIPAGTTTVGVTVASITQIIEFFLGILSALARVHAQGVFHRDIKPENILVSQDGVAKLADFSIARDTHKEGVTRAGLVPGTPQYMSPEQSLDETVGVTSDLFSLGLTLHRVLTGRSIYATELGDETKTQQVIRHLWSLYTNKTEFNFEFPEELPAAFHDVIRRACRIDPRERYQTALEMREALASASRSPYTATEAPPPARGASRPIDPDVRDREPARSGRRVLIATAGVAVLAILAGLVALYLRTPSSGGLADQLLERTRARGQQASELARWLEARPDEPARELAAQARGDLRRFSEDLAQAETDKVEGFVDLALRQLDRAEQGFTTLCDRFTSEYLEGALAREEGAARDEYAKIDDEVRALAPKPSAELEQKFAQLSAAIGSRGCERGEGMRARIETAVSVRKLSAEALSSAEQALPAAVAQQLLLADAAFAKAREPALTNEHYLERLREGEAQLESARSAQTNGELSAALAAAQLASQSLERTALIGEAAALQARAESLVQQIDAIEAPLGPMRLAFDSAQRSFVAGEWQQASSSFAGLAPELEARLAAATPVVEAARRQDSVCRDAEGSSEELAQVRQFELDARAKFRAAKFDEAAALFAGLEAKCGEITVAAGDRAAREVALAREEGEKLDLQARQQRAAEEARSRALDASDRLSAQGVGIAALEPDLQVAGSLLGEGQFEASERAFREVDGRLREFANEARQVVALREQAKKEARSVRTGGVPDAELAAGNARSEAGEKLLASGELAAARSEFEAALASYREAQSAFRARQGAELAKRERELEAERAARAAVDRELAEQRALASKPRDQLARSISDLQAKGLPLGEVAAARNAAEADYSAQRFGEAATGFARADELAARQLEAGRPVLAARADAQAARERALARGASGKPLADAAKRFDTAAADLSAGRLSAALDGFRAAITSYDTAESDPGEVVKLLFSNWDLAWSERDIKLLRRTQSLTAAQEQGFAKVFSDNDEIRQRTRVIGIAKAGNDAYDVQVEYTRVLKAGVAEKKQESQKRVARVERSGASWIIATVSR